MMDSLVTEIAQRRNAAKAEIEALRAEIIGLENDVSFYDKAEAEITGRSLTVFRSSSLDKRKMPEPLPIIYRTIKQMILIVLEDYPKGIVALDILNEVNKRFDQEFPRTSLSPQLSRLRQSGDIHKSGKRWILGAAILMEVPI